MGQVFYRKWRPQTLAEVVGQEHVTQTLLRALEAGRVAHAYLFCGPRGTGKTSTGRILAKAVNCLNSGRGEPCNTCAVCQSFNQGQALDLIEMDAASNRRIDEIRELRERVGYTPTVARYKVYILDEVHQLTPEAFNALLKTLEEPPPHAIFILASTEPHKIPATIQSRCQRFDFRRIPLEAMTARLRYVCQQEGLDCEEAALALMAKAASGSLRDAENMLEQVAVSYGNAVKLSQVRAMLGLTGDPRVQELAGHILGRNLKAGLEVIASVAADGLDLRQFHRELVEALRALLVLKSGAGGIAGLTHEAQTVQGVVARHRLEDMVEALRLFAPLEPGLADTLPLELALARFTLGPAAVPPASPSLPAPTPAPRPEPSPPPPPRSAAPHMPLREPQPPPSVRSPAPAVPPREAQPPAARPAAPPPPAPAALPLAPPALAPDAVIQWLRDNWRRMLEAAPPALKRHPALALLRSGCLPVRVNGDAILLEFRYPMHRERIEAEENRRVVEGLLSQVLGAPFKVKCTTKTNAVKEPPPTPGAKGADPLVEAARGLGAQFLEDGPDDEP
ncbi:MAG: DNA polymerase III subunit gamma/tau [Chloroflexi bacterium]|nr:DNA polymerase III subunit gamma/tau [Chloroflexota bacterium]